MEKRKQIKNLCRSLAALLLAVAYILSTQSILAGAKNIVMPKKKSIFVGKSVRVLSETDGVTFSSSNSSVACVSQDGLVFGKKKGVVKIRAKLSGEKMQSCTVTVKERKRLPKKLPVAIGEVVQTNVSMRQQEDGTYTFYSTIANNAQKGSIKKIIYYYSIRVKGETLPDDDTATGDAITPLPEENMVEKTVTLTAKNIDAGDTSEEISCQGDYSGEISEMSLTKIELYSGKARQIYNPVKKSYSFKWGTKDTAAPVFSGLLKGKSGVNGDYYRIYYSDKKEMYSFKKFVTAKDNRDGKVKVNADLSKINWKKSGVYKIYFWAEDKAGNVGKTWAKVQVFVPGTAERIADQILRSITRKNWSNVKKARAIYRYITRHCSYVAHTGHIQWRNAAVKSFRYHSGDCYSYFAMSKLLMTRAGIPNIQIKRYPTPHGLRHFWNLVYVNGGWYHFDTTPRTRGGNFCLKTDAQLWAYSRGYTFQFKRNIYPTRAKKAL